MAVPKKRTTSSRRDKRRAHDALKPVNVIYDKETGTHRLPHHVSSSSGTYNGVFVLKVSSEKETSNNDK